MDLQTAFYLVGIVYMTVMLALTIALIAAVYVIRNRINDIHRRIDEKLSTITAVANRGKEFVHLVTRVKRALQGR